MTAPARIVTGKQIQDALSIGRSTLHGWRRAGWFPAPINTARTEWRHYPIAYYNLESVVEAVRGRFSDEMADLLEKGFTERARREGA